MLKLLSTDDFDFGQPAVNIIPTCSYGVDRDWIKQASVLQQEIGELKPSKDMTYIHVFAVGDTEKYGANKNADGFSARWNKIAHPRFVESGRVHKHHQNKDPAKAVGQCKYSAHNDDMWRVELIMGLDNEKCAEEINDYENGKDIPVSMGCKVAFDVCSICGNKAPNPDHHCRHMKKYAGRILDDGRQVYVDNPDPKYFEISLVRRPADRCGYSFRKVAGVGASLDMDFVSSVDLFKAAGLWVPTHIALEEAGGRAAEKLSMLQKLSELEKEIEAKLTPVDQALSEQLPEEELDDDDVSQVHQLGSGGLGKTIGLMNQAKVLLPLKDFLKLINSKGHFDVNDVAPAVSEQLPGIFGHMLEDDPMACCGNEMFDGESSDGLPTFVRRMVSRLVPSLGMSEEPLGGRVMITVIRSKPKVKVAHTIYRDDPLIKGLAKLYATYKLSFVTQEENQRDPVLIRATVTGNY